MPKITVFVPYYNDKLYIRECIESILTQSHENFELILLNHASTDGTDSIVKEYRDPRIKHISLEENHGAGGGLLLQAALDNATGELFKPFCADDIMMSDCLADLKSLFWQDPSFDVVFGNMLLVDRNALPIRECGSTRTWWDMKYNYICGRDFEEALLAEFFKGNSTLPFPASMIRTEVLRGITLDSVLHNQFDMTLWVQLLGQGKKFGLILLDVCKYRIHPEQASSSSRSKQILISSAFEGQHYCSYLMNVSSVKLIKKMMPSNFYARILSEGDERYIPFVVCQHFSTSASSSYRAAGLNNLYYLLNDKQSREAIKTKFGYHVRQLREAYGETCLFESIKDTSSKQLVKILRRRLKAWVKGLFKGKVNQLTVI